MTSPHLDWTSAEGEYLQHAVGRYGEQTLGFHLGQDGYIILYGPGGTTRFPRADTRKVHQPTTKGLDMIAYHPKTGEILILDNKAGAAGGAIDDVSAFTRDLRKKLLNRIAKLERGRAHLPPAAQKHLDDALKSLKQAERALGGHGAWPKKVSLAVANAAGAARGIAPELAKKLSRFGIRFIDVNAARSAARAPKTGRLIAKAAASRLRRAAAGAELGFLKGVAKQAAGKAATGKAMGKAVAKATGKLLLRAAASKAAKRTASLLPVIGWGFAAKDAVAGVEDILRGHAARGMAGVGMAISDVASDFLHIGDAVSGVGGTALSLGAQGALIAGQLAIEMDRMKEKMQALQDEIERTGKLPDERRLREEFDLDDEAIADLRKEMAQAESTEPDEEDLPPPPDWGQQWEEIWPEPPIHRSPAPSPVHRDIPAPRPRAPVPAPPGPPPFWNENIA